MHWSDLIAQRALKRVGFKDEVVVGSGISLSGPVHIGHSREFITAALIANAVERQGGKSRLIAFVDDMDPLRKVYPFLTSDYDRWVGCPLYRIADPWGCHASYADHFLQELVDGFSVLGIKPEIIRSSEMYNSGQFFPLVERSLSARKEIEVILDDIAGSGRGAPRTTKKEWPFQPECPNCTSLRETHILSAEGGGALVIHCKACEEDYRVNIQGGAGKLTWRCDWPMRWAHLGVTVEPFGHDHAAAGGSYESGKVLAEKIYNIDAPIPVPYGWIHFKSGEAMHSSSGKAVPIAQLVKAYPPEVIWWMIARKDPIATIQFDPETTLLEEVGHLRKAFEQDQDGAHAESVSVVESIVGIRQSLLTYPFDHLALVAQLAQFQPEATLEVLRRSSVYADTDVPVTQDDLNYVKEWLDLYGDRLRIRLRKPGEKIAGRSAGLEPALKILQARFQEIDWEAQLIHDVVHDAAKVTSVGAGALFSELYRLAIGQDRGPKIGWLFETLGRNKVLELLA